MGKLFFFYTIVELKCCICYIGRDADIIIAFTRSFKVGFSEVTGTSVSFPAESFSAPSPVWVLWAVLGSVSPAAPERIF